MTEDQIKAIAEKIVDGDTLHIKGYVLHPGVTIPIIEDAIEQLLKDYCIVEREKVMEMYSSLKTPDYPCVDPKPTGVARIVMCNLFGNSMFNQNEE